MNNWDYIVIGGGAAGATAAARLSDDASVSVLLIEAGGGGRNPCLQVPNGIFFVKGSPRYHWLMDTEPDPTRNNRVETLTCGRGLGGGSSINGMVFVKGLRHDYDEWESRCGPDWRLEAVNRAYQRVEERLTIDTPQPLHVSSKHFLNSALNAGLQANSDDLMKTGNGVMPAPTTAANGFRQSTERAYLRPARRRRNLEVRTHCRALRLVADGNRVSGVEVEEKGNTHIHSANREVILSAGAINSPQLLMLSGIGPAAHLESIGIKTILDQPAVGEGLQDHPCVWISSATRIKTWNDTMKPLGMIGAGLEWILHREGPAASAMCQVTLYGSSLGSDCPPDYQTSFMPAGYIVLDDGIEFLQTSSITSAVSLCRPTGTGSVRLRSNNPAESPVISYRLLETNNDISILRRACQNLREIYAAKPLSDVITKECAPGIKVQSDKEWDDYIRRYAVNMCHPAASCRMGSDSASVVDPQFRLRGLQGLRIADASVMPRITSGNTNAPAIMIGERLAEFCSESL